MGDYENAIKKFEANTREYGMSVKASKELYDEFEYARNIAQQMREAQDAQAARILGFSMDNPDPRLVAAVRAAETYVREQTEENLLALAQALDQVPEEWRLSDKDFKNAVFTYYGNKT